VADDTALNATNANNGFMNRPVPIKPAAGQESVWDYPRPPRLELSHKHIEIICAGVKIADSSRAFRVLETSHPPVYYIPLADIKRSNLELTNGTSFCEWKGAASYYSVRIGQHFVPEAAWYYPEPSKAFHAIKHHVAFYAARMNLLEGDGCFVDGERVVPQPGEFYGGWITSDIVGPFKGEPGSRGW
jgi:uncharacterized protein (DUF427 family)